MNNPDVTVKLNAPAASTPASGCAALVEKIKAERARTHRRWAEYVERGYVQDRHYASGQLDAYDEVLAWIAEAQHNSEIRDSRRE